jgi:hypothetical protein
MKLKLWKKGHGQIYVVEFFYDDGSWRVSIVSEKKGVLFEIRGEKLI